MKTPPIPSTSNILIFIAVCLIVFLSITNFFSSMNKIIGVKDDNVIEEVVEDLLESKTGIKLDLTPESEES